MRFKIKNAILIEYFLLLIHWIPLNLTFCIFNISLKIWKLFVSFLKKKVCICTKRIFLILSHAIYPWWSVSLHKRTCGLNVSGKRRDDNSLEWSNFCRHFVVRSCSYNILVDRVHFDHDGRDTVALRFTERFDDGTPKSLRGPAADATTASR